MKKQEQNTKETVSMLVYGYLVILFAGLPLYMQNKLVMIGNAKYLFFRNTTLVLGAFVVLAVLWQGIRGEWTTKRTWKKTDVFMLLYLVSAIFSYGISPCREDVLLGYPGWYMGLVTQGLLVGIYFAVSRYYDGSRSIWWIAGRGFAQFQDVIRNRENSPYVNWFYRIDFGGNSNYNDGLWYEGWEGCFDLVKLNLQNPDVVNYLLDSVKGWIDEFGIDGLRLDVAYSLDENFVRRLREVTSAYKQDFFLLGEMLHGDYNRLMNDQMLHSATNYECYKGLYSSFNSMNMFEIVHSLLRQFGPENWTLYKGKHLLSFVDNHDVTRVASILNNENHLPLIYAMAFGMPGIPCVYYGSEWGFKARKEDGDPALRPCFDKPEWNGLCDWISKLTEAKKHSEALNYGAFRSVLLTNKQCIFERKSEHERVMVAINADGADFMAHFDAGCGTAVDLITGEKHDFGGGSLLPAYSAYFWLMEN